jgi:hypothetical protein
LGSPPQEVDGLLAFLDACDIFIKGGELSDVVGEHHQFFAVGIILNHSQFDVFVGVLSKFIENLYFFFFCISHSFLLPDHCLPHPHPQDWVEIHYHFYSTSVVAA